MKFFTKKELVAVGIILFVLSIVSYRNFQIALRRARDSQRRSDLGSLNDALSKYYEDFSFVPLSSSKGNIKACKGSNYDQLMQELKQEKSFDTKLYLEGLTDCVWGKDSLSDLQDSTYPDYLKLIPEDPLQSEGYSYLYIADGKFYQIYAYLEGGSDEEGYDGKIVSRNLRCGTHICNFGKAYGETPLDKSLQQYENELIQKNK